MAGMRIFAVQALPSKRVQSKRWSQSRGRTRDYHGDNIQSFDLLLFSLSLSLSPKLDDDNKRERIKRL